MLTVIVITPLLQTLLWFHYINFFALYPNCWILACQSSHETLGHMIMHEIYNIDYLTSKAPNLLYIILAYLLNSMNLHNEKGKQNCTYITCIADAMRWIVIFCTGKEKIAKHKHTAWKFKQIFICLIMWWCLGQSRTIIITCHMYKSQD